jgi:hypothetical protein
MLSVPQEARSRFYEKVTAISHGMVTDGDFKKEDHTAEQVRGRFREKIVPSEVRNLNTPVGRVVRSEVCTHNRRGKRGYQPGTGSTVHAQRHSPLLTALTTLATGNRGYRRGY